MSQTPDKLPLLYDTETTGGWTHGMVAVVESMLGKLSLPPAAQVLEVGCGSGATVRALRRLFPGAHVTGLDLHPLALAHAAAQERAGDGSALPALVRGNLLHLPIAGESLDLLLALDSFDQSGVALEVALAEARRVLKPGGLLLLRVSAHAWLQGAHDIAFNTGRRYSRDEIKTALRSTGYEPLHLSYANSLLAPPVIAMRLAQSRLGGGGGDSLYASPLANEVVRLALTLEAAWMRRASLPFGLSLLVVAQKTAGPA